MAPVTVVLNIPHSALCPFLGWEGVAAPGQPNCHNCFLEETGMKSGIAVGRELRVTQVSATCLPTSNFLCALTQGQKPLFLHHMSKRGPDFFGGHLTPEWRNLYRK